jgi:predicted DNA-binding ribbon-helix-helix protein
MTFWNYVLDISPLIAILVAWKIALKMVNKMVPPPGMDMRIAKEQLWWDDISHIIETDDDTTKRLVENVYDNVSGAKLAELKFVADQITAGADTASLINQIAKRQALIEYYQDPTKIDVDANIGKSNE